MIKLEKALRNILLIIIFIPILAIPQKNNDCQLRIKAFDFGESLEYTIYYNLSAVWVAAGEVTFRVDSTLIKSKTYYKLSGIGQTFKKYDWIYKVRDHYESILTVSDFKPIRFKRKVKEGSFFIDEDYVFNHGKSKVYSLRKLEEDGNFIKDTVPFSKCSYDVLSMIYYARNIDFSNLSINAKVTITVFLDNEEHSSYIQYLGKEEMEIKGMGTYRCIKFKPLLIEGTIFNAGDDMTVWVTDDIHKIPLLIETPILVGSIKARIKTIEGKNIILSSKIK